MASKNTVDDPLRGMGAFDDQDMEDLTAHLASLPTGRNSHDGLDLGDHAELLQGNMDRFRALADDESNDLFTSFGGLGGLGQGFPIPSTSASGTANNLITTTIYPTYGELAAAKPPSYEDSIMYEQAPMLSLAAGAALDAASGADAAARRGTGGDPLVTQHERTTAPGDRTAHMATYGGPLDSMAPGRGGGAVPGPGVSDGYRHQQHLPQPLEGSPLGPAAGGGTVAGASRPHAGGAGGGGSGVSTVSGAAGAALDALGLHGSGELRDEDLQIIPTQRPSSQRHLAAAGAPTRGSVGHTAPQITVTEPIKREQGGLFGIKGGYVTYLVRARGRSGGDSGGPRPDTAVRRRFREFVSLSEMLKDKYRGYFVPPRPEKNAVEGQRMTDTFVEDRRVALERYLNKLARHPVISASEELRLFLETEGELADCPAWLALRPAGGGGSVLDGTARFSKQILGLDRGVTDPVQAAQPTKKATDFMRAIKETARSMQVPSGSLPPDEVALQRCREEVEGLQGALTTASRAAERLVSRLDRWSVVSGELGLALFQMRKAEQVDGVALAQHTGTLKQSGSLMHDTERMGTALVRGSRIGRKVVGKSAIQLDCLHEYLALMPAALKGLRAREKALLTADTLTADRDGRRRAITDLEAAGAKVLGGDAAKAKKVSDLSGDVAVLEQSIAAARSQYDRIKGVNQAEMSRLRSDFRGDMAAMLQSYAAVMSACAQRHLEIWLQAASELQATPEQLARAKAPLVGPPSSQPSLNGANNHQPLRQPSLDHQPPRSNHQHNTLASTSSTNYPQPQQQRSSHQRTSQFTISSGGGSGSGGTGASTSGELGAVDLHGPVGGGRAGGSGGGGRSTFPL